MRQRVSSPGEERPEADRPLRPLFEVARVTSGLARGLAQLPRAIGNRLEALDRGVQEILSVLPGAAEDLHGMRGLLEAQYEHVSAAVSTLSGLAEDFERLRAAVEPQMRRVTALDQTAGRIEEHLLDLQQKISKLERAAEAAIERLPDPDAPGPLARARDALTGGD